MRDSLSRTVMLLLSILQIPVVLQQSSNVWKPPSQSNDAQGHLRQANHLQYILCSHHHIHWGVGVNVWPAKKLPKSCNLAAAILACNEQGCVCSEHLSH